MLYKAKLISYQENKNGRTNAIVSSFDWESHSSLIKNTPLVQKVTLLKYIHGWLATKKEELGKGLLAVPNVCFHRRRR